MPMNAPLVTNERDGLLSFLEHQRQAVRYATFGLSDERARLTPTPSSLSLGGLIKHLAYGERNWTDRIRGLPAGDGEFETYMASFHLGNGESLAQALDDYERVAADTDSLIRGIDDLGSRVPLPAAPWYPDPEGCTVRWVLLHLIEETARHAGHADVIREALDGGLSGPLMAAAEGWPDSGWIKPWTPAE